MGFIGIVVCSVSSFINVIRYRLSPRSPRSASRGRGPGPMHTAQLRRAVPRMDSIARAACQDAGAIWPISVERCADPTGNAALVCTEASRILLEDAGSMKNNDG